MGCTERATADVQCVLLRSRHPGAIVRRLAGRLDSIWGESSLSGKRVRLDSLTTFQFQHELVAVCAPSVGSWSSWHATTRTRPINDCQATRSQDVVNRVLPLTLTSEDGRLENWKQWRFRRDLGNCRNIAISNNVGGVKHFLSTLLHALVEERHFALVGGSRFPTW